MNTHYKYLTSIAMLFVALLLFANITAEKLVQFGWFVMPASIIIYPLLYIIGSIITEVYGHKEAAIITVTATAINLLMAIIFLIVIQLPSAGIYHHQTAFAMVLGSTPRIVIASIVSFWCGEMSNIFIAATLKRKGHFPLRLRAIVANSTGLLVDCIIFIFIAFSNLSWRNILIVSGSYFLFKVIYELILISFMRYPIQFLTLNEIHPTKDVDMLKRVKQHD